MTELSYFQKRALELGVAQQIALKFSNWFQIECLKLEIPVEQALKFSNWFQFDSLKLGTPVEQALKFSNPGQITTLKVLHAMHQKELDIASTEEVKKNILEKIINQALKLQIELDFVWRTDQILDIDIPIEYALKFTGWSSIKTLKFFKKKYQKNLDSTTTYEEKDAVIKKIVSEALEFLSLDKELYYFSTENQFWLAIDNPMENSSIFKQPLNNIFFVDLDDSFAPPTSNSALINASYYTWYKDGGYYNHLSPLKSLIKHLPTNQDTKIYINVHGSPSLTLSGHAIHPPKYSFYGVPTHNLFSTFSHNNAQPVQIFLLSCYSGAAKYDISALPEGSVLITSSSPIEVSYGTPFMNNIVTNPSPYISFLKLITLPASKQNWPLHEFGFTTSVKQNIYTFAAVVGQSDEVQEKKYRNTLNFMKFYFELSNKYGNTSFYLNSQGDVHKTMMALYLNSFDFPKDLTCISSDIAKARNFLKDHYENTDGIFDNIIDDIFPMCYKISEELGSIASILKEGADTGQNCLLEMSNTRNSLESYKLYPTTLAKVFIQNPTSVICLIGRLIEHVSEFDAPQLLCSDG